MNSKQVVLHHRFEHPASAGLFADTLARKGHTVFATMRDLGRPQCQECLRNRALRKRESLPISRP